VFGKILLLALFGFLAITFAAPVLALLTVVLFFAIIGFILWLPIHTLVLGKKPGWDMWLSRTHAISRKIGGVLVASWQGVQQALTGNCDGLRSTAAFTGALLVEGLSGAVVALLLVVSIGGHHSENPLTLVLTGLCGGLLGVLVVFFRRGANREAVVGETGQNA
jgi:hypothetical protein